MKNNKKHRFIQINRVRFVESVYHIVTYGYTLRNLQKLFEGAAGKLTEYERMILRYSVQTNVLINVVSLTDELNSYLFKFKAADDSVKQRIAAYKHMIQPALEFLNQWPDIRRFRNNVLAHNFRIDSHEFESVHLSGSLSSYRIPSSVIDLILLFKLLDSITKIAEEIFSAEYEDAKQIVDSFSGSKAPKQSLEESFSKINSVLLEMNTRIASYNSAVGSLSAF